MNLHRKELKKKKKFEHVQGDGPVWTLLFTSLLALLAVRAQEGPRGDGTVHVLEVDAESGAS